jgi:hypothetical protein
VLLKPFELNRGILVPSYAEVIDFLGADIAGQYRRAVCRHTQLFISILV